MPPPKPPPPPTDRPTDRPTDDVVLCYARTWRGVAAVVPSLGSVVGSGAVAQGRMGKKQAGGHH